MAKEYIEKSEALRAIARSNSVNDAYKLVDGLTGPKIGNGDISAIPEPFRRYFSRGEKFINIDGCNLVGAYRIVEISQELQGL